MTWKDVHEIASIAHSTCKGAMSERLPLMASTVPSGRGMRLTLALSVKASFLVTIAARLVARFSPNSTLLLLGMAVENSLNFIFPVLLKCLSVGTSQFKKG